jgi:hypothetical protein
VKYVQVELAVIKNIASPVVKGIVPKPTDDSSPKQRVKHTNAVRNSNTISGRNSDAHETNRLEYSARAQPAMSRICSSLFGESSSPGSSLINHNNNHSSLLCLWNLKIMKDTLKLLLFHLRMLLYAVTIAYPFGSSRGLRTCIQPCKFSVVSENFNNLFNYQSSSPSSSLTFHEPNRLVNITREEMGWIYCY